MTKMPRCPLNNGSKEYHSTAGQWPFHSKEYRSTTGQWPFHSKEYHSTTGQQPFHSKEYHSTTEMQNSKKSAVPLLYFVSKCNVGQSVMFFYINSKTCLNRTPLGLKNLFTLDRCLVYTGSNDIDISLAQAGFWFTQGSVQTSFTAYAFLLNVYPLSQLNSIDHNRERHLILLFLLHWQILQQDVVSSHQTHRTQTLMQQLLIYSYLCPSCQILTHKPTNKQICVITL